MNPIQLSKHLHEAFINYLSTTFNVNRDGQQARLQASIQESFRAFSSLSRGPYLEITPPYMLGKSINDLCNEGILTPEWSSLSNENLPIPLNASLYHHQERATRAYHAGDSMVISSGTGSGKTESFLIPILDDLLKNPQPGVRAVLIYPMNALVNDQLDRLRKLLKGTNITFGRYTSELEDKESKARQETTLPNEVVSREMIRNGNMIPQILITNYAMLEYLLLRPEDSLLFESGTWRFLVLDEAHTYSGAQGIEVSYLIRRLKQRLKKQQGDMLCIATSATLTDDVQIAADFASKIFGEVIEPHNIIIGKENPKHVPSVPADSIDPQKYLKEEFNDLLDSMRRSDCDLHDVAKKLSGWGIVPYSYRQPLETHHTVAEYLWDALAGNPHLTDLRQNQTNTSELDSVASRLFGENLYPHDRLRALYNIIELGNIARPDDKSAPMLSARYHLFMRPPQGVWVCVNPNCQGHEGGEEGWAKLFSTKRERCDACESLVYPLVICRDCGQTYIKTVLSDRKYLAESVDKPNEYRYLVWKEPQINYALAEEDETNEDEKVTNNSEDVKFETVRICLKCGKEDPRTCCESPQVVELFLAMQIDKNNKKGELKRPLNEINECLRCGAKAIKGSEIVTPISVKGSTPLSILTAELYRYLPAVSNKPGNSRKLLTFYDSRQGAARFAAFLQATADEQHYDHIIPKVIENIENSKKYLPNIESVTSDAIQSGWENRLYQHDQAFEHIKLDRQSPNQNDREELSKFWKAIILSQFSTRRKRRQSLESLGVVGVKYFENESDFNVSSIVPSLGFSEQQTKALIEFLLDGIRQNKAIKFPKDVSIDNERFGNNVGNPRIVKSNAQKGELPWIGVTDKHTRKLYIQKVLKKLGMNYSPPSVDHVLSIIWDWLKAQTFFREVTQAGYQLDYNEFYLSTQLDWCQCQQCQRVYARSNALPCPHPRCDGELKPINIRSIQEDNYFYQNMQRSIIPMRVEEHTAQLAPEKGRKYQDKFRDGDINVLSCSTTFEMGIDLGDLQSVVMSNVPPTVANYRQRSGRAGRRVGGTAFILTWADERPHDQAYFKNPIEIIQGSIKVPYIAIDNPVIEQRHMNAVILSAFLRYRKTSGHTELSKVKPFFDPTQPERHYEALEAWMRNRSDEIHLGLSQFILGEISDSRVNAWLVHFREDMQHVEDEYKKRYEYYTHRIETLLQKMSSDTSKNIENDRREFINLLERLNDEELISFLSSKGVLPSYSFPLYTVELVLPVPQKDKGLRLQRDLKQAIREYAPTSEVVADKRIWRSDGVRFYRDTVVRSKEYIICENCNYIQISDIEGKELELSGRNCSVCQKPRGKIKGNQAKKFVIPDDFFAGSRDNGKPARQYVNTPVVDMRSALIPQKTLDGREQILKYIECIYERDGKLLYVNEGKFGQGFKIALEGEQIGQVTTNSNPVSLGHEQKTDVLHLHFRGDTNFTVPGLEDQSFWLSLMYALIQGACKALQIERRDIDGVLSPRASDNGSWEQVVVLYDNVPGGAGHVKRIKQEFLSVIKETLRILNCTDCSSDTSCYHCIRDYNNQIYHPLLKRESALKYLELIHYANQTSKNPIKGTSMVIASNPDYWLLQQVQYAKHKVSLWIDSLSVEPVSGSQYDWLETLQNCLQRGVQIDLFVKSSIEEDVVLLHYLRYIISHYPNFKLNKIKQVPVWNIIIDDASKSSARAISIKTKQGDICLVSLSIETIDSTTDFDGINQIMQQLMQVPYQVAVLPSEKENNVVISVKQGQITNERELFGEYFKKPVLSLRVNDPYLTNRYRIVDRLGTYLDMAEKTDSLPSITVVTSPDDRNKPSEQQKSAFQTLKKFYGDRLEVKYVGAEHDRYVYITYKDGSKVRIIIGRGLDFIQSDGKCLKTYITISQEG
jgi:ATP-dependent helicase YprA (DUF1998 family)